MKKKEYDLILGCGCNCCSSRNLRDNHLQYKSYPFDWIGGFSPIMFFDLFKENFENFLNKDSLIFLSKSVEGEKKISIRIQNMVLTSFTILKPEKT